MCYVSSWLLLLLACNSSVFYFDRPFPNTFFLDRMKRQNKTQSSVPLTCSTLQVFPNTRGTVDKPDSTDNLQGTSSIAECLKLFENNDQPSIVAEETCENHKDREENGGNNLFTLKGDNSSKILLEKLEEEVGIVMNLKMYPLN